MQLEIQALRFKFQEFVDLRLFNLINQLAGEYEWLDKFATFFAEFAPVFLAVLVALLWFMDYGSQRKKNQYAVVLAVEAFILGRLILNPILKIIFDRARPFLDHEATVLITQNPLEAAFPSGHAVAALALALPVFIYNKRAGIWLVFLAIVIGLSRVFVGVHYPGDVLAGFAFATIIVLILNYYRNFLIAPIVNFFNKEE